MTFKLLCLGAAAALVISPAAFAQTGSTMGAAKPAPTVDTPTAPVTPAAPIGPAQTAAPSADVGSAANANATVGGASVDASGATSATAKKKAKHGAVNGSAAAGATTPNATTPAPNSTTPAPQ